MTGWEAAFWGLLGGMVAEALNLTASMRPTRPGQAWRWPWLGTADRPMVLVAVTLRLFVGSALAAVLGASGELPTPFAAFLAGLAAPLTVARIFQAIPVADADQSALPVQVPAATSIDGATSARVEHGPQDSHSGVAEDSGIVDAAS